MLSESKLYAVLPAADIARAKQFYEEKLDLTTVREAPGGYVYECNGTFFLLYESKYAGTAQNTAMAWEVDNLEEAMSKLKDKGIVFEIYDMPGVDPETGIVRDEGMQGAWFKDSEDNILSLFQRD